MPRSIVMLLTNAFAPDVRVYKEAQALVAHGHTVTVLCWDKQPEEGRSLNEYIEGIHILRFPIASVAGSGTKQLPAYLHYILSCRKYLHTHPCDSLHCHDLDGTIAGVLARKKQTPYIFDMHELYEKGNPAKRRFIRKLVAHLVKGSAAVLYVSEAQKAGLESYSGKFIPLKNYPDTTQVRYASKTASAFFRVGYLGTVRKQLKEFTALFEAVNALPNVRVHIYGGGTDLHALRQCSARYENVCIHGPYDGTTQTSSLFADIDVLFCGYDPSDPNYQGPFEPVKFFEAIITHTPMLATAALELGQRVQASGFGLAVDTRDPQSIRQAIRTLKEDQAFYTACAEREAAAAPQYDWAQAVKVLERIYG